MRKLFIVTLLLVATIIAANGLLITLPAHQRLSADPRNDSVKIISYFNWGIDPTTLNIDIYDIGTKASMADVDRALLDIAHAFSEKDFSTVILSFRGSARFKMTGSYFKKLGLEREWQNPVYTIRTLAENIQTLSGTPAFPKWEGGLLGVMNK